MVHKETSIRIDVTAKTGGGQFKIGPVVGGIDDLVSAVQSWQDQNPRKKILFISIETNREFFALNNILFQFRVGPYSVRQINGVWCIMDGEYRMDTYDNSIDCALACAEEYIVNRIIHKSALYMKSFYCVFLCDIWKSKAFTDVTAVCTTMPKLKKVLRQLMLDKKISLQEGYTMAEFKTAMGVRDLNNMLDYVYIDSIEPNTIQ